MRSDDYPHGWTDEDWLEFERFVREDWGKPESPRDVAVSGAHDEAFRNWYATLMRQGASPRAVLLLAEMSKAVDVRSLLPRVAVPTLAMHRAGDRVVEVESGRYLAEGIPDARWVELSRRGLHPVGGRPGHDRRRDGGVPTGPRIGSEATRIVATVTFTDLVGSTAPAGALVIPHGVNCSAALLEGARGAPPLRGPRNRHRR